MGLSKSKAPKPGQNGFPNQSGFQTSQQMQNQSPFSSGQMPAGGGFPGQSTFGSPAQGFGAATNFGQPPAPQGFGGQPTGFSSNQMGFPPFPPQPSQQQLTGFPPSSLFPSPMNAPPPPLGPSSGYPVSYQNQTFRPLIPGYAPAPGNDRRGGAPQDHHHHHQEQGDFSNRFFNDQMHQVPPMGQMHKPRKH